MVSLTEREASVLRLLAHGQTDRQIADSLSISVSTVETYVGFVRRKVGLDLTRVELALFYWSSRGVQFPPRKGARAS